MIFLKFIEKTEPNPIKHRIDQQGADQENRRCNQDDSRFLGAQFHLFILFVFDGFVKSPTAALRFIFRHCGVLVSTPHSSRFASLTFGAFYFAVPFLTSYEFIIFGATRRCREAPGTALDYLTILRNPYPLRAPPLSSGPCQWPFGEARSPWSPPSPYPSVSRSQGSP